AYKHIKEKASPIDIPLAKHADAEQVRLKKRLAATEKRMLRALKKKNETDVQTIQQLKDSLFPGGNLQERTENVFPFIAEYGKVFFDDLLKVMDLFPQNFQVLSFDSK
ncbi:MAG: bacillithiol biosynthesis BshC, partial [Bacteroidetes bacterium]|nr:bacillithiol biosynthesis BshC [Bacteroidota bacterium]